MTRPRLSLLILFALVAGALILARPAFSYLPQGSALGSAFVPAAWTSPPLWVINPAVSGGGVTANIAGTPSDVTSTMSAAFSTWVHAPNINLGVSTSPYGDSTATSPQNNINLVCFICTGLDFSADGALAVTITSYNVTTGELTNASIYFNPAPEVDGTPVCFTTSDTNASCPQSGSEMEDLQTVATHDVGHFFGLDHSAIVRAIMYPFAPPVLTTLSYDDVAGMSLLYPKSTADVQTGAIQGTVALNGSAVFGAHVFANSSTTATPFSGFPAIRKTPIGTLTDPTGSYTISGVPADSYEVIAEPLDGPVADGNVDWAAEWQQTEVETDFTTRWY